MKPEDLANLSVEEKRMILAKILAKKAAASPPPVGNRLNQFAVSVEDLQGEVFLDASIQPASNGSSFDSSSDPHIFLTGATGFLGAYLLRDLSQNTTRPIRCLVRCENVQEGSNRLKQNYREYMGDTGYPAERVIPVPGDLAKPRLGLSDYEFNTLASTVDTIFHSGAYVNWLYPYAKLKPANVLGTHEVLRLACHSKTKPVHFISTVAVFSLIAGTAIETITEDESLDHAGMLYGGYCQSKWVAEKLVQIARSRGLPAVIYRPGLVAGDSRTGASNTDDVLSKVLRSWVEAGSVPEMDASAHITPVDYVSRAIVYLSRSPKSLGRVFHLFNPQPVQIAAVSAAIKSMGFQLQKLDYDRWRSKMSALTTVKNSGSLSSLALFFEDQSENTLDALGILLTTHPPKFDARRTLEALSGSSIVCPPVDVEMLKSYFSFFVRKGLLRQAAASGQP